MRTAPRTLLFGTAGPPLSAGDASSLRGLEHVKGLGLDGMEVEFVRGVKMGRDTAEAVRAKAEALGLRLSAHAPYYINFNSEDPAQRLLSQERLLTTARVAAWMGAYSVVFHAGYMGKSTPERAYEEVRAGISQVMRIVRAERLDVRLRVETMGKRSQFGTLDEVLQLCRDVEGLQPCLDFSHLHAREGRVNEYADFERVLAKVGKRLGRAALHDAHIHISGAHYSDAGELKHLDLQESDFNYEEWIQALRDAEVRGMVISESPNIESDALMLKTLYRSVSSAGA